MVERRIRTRVIADSSAAAAVQPVTAESRLRRVSRLEATVGLEAAVPEHTVRHATELCVWTAAREGNYLCVASPRVVSE